MPNDSSEHLVIVKAGVKNAGQNYDVTDFMDLALALATDRIEILVPIDW